MATKSRAARRFLSVFLFLAIAVGTAVQAIPSASAALVYPAQILNLTNWKQTLPTGSSGSPTEIKQTSLATYVNSPYFHVNAASDGVIFRAPVNGVTTSGSGYPRSELREMTNNGTSNASWSTTSGTHMMFIDQAITSVPKSKKHVVAGQIHNSSDDVIVIRLEYPKLFVDINGNTGPTLDANYTLGKRFKVKFVANNGQIKVYYNGSQSPVYTLSKSGSGNYFKAGAYTQSNCSKETVCDSSNYGEVVIHNLSVQHFSSNSAPTPDPTSAPEPILVSSPTPEPAPAPTPAPTTEPVPAPVVASGLSFEAESGAITSPMQTVSDSSASNGKYIVQTVDSPEGSASYSFNVPSAGKYQLRAKVISPNGSSNSIRYALDGNSTSDWSFPDNINNWTWVDGATLTLSQGAHTLNIKKREKNTKLDSFEFKSVVSDPAVVVSTSISATSLFEAEAATVSGGMRIIDDATASGGKYLRAESSGAATYKINIPTSGKYKVAGWIKADNTSSDSFYVSVDGKSSFIWALLSPLFTWTFDIFDGNVFSLDAGDHTLTLKYREAGAKIDRLVLIKQ